MVTFLVGIKWNFLRNQCEFIVQVSWAIGTEPFDETFKRPPKRAN